MDSGLKYSQEYIVLTGVQLRILIGISIKLVVVLSRVQILIGISIAPGQTHYHTPPNPSFGVHHQFQL